MHRIAAMIIGMSLLLPIGTPLRAADELGLPDPAAFSTNLELGDLARAQAWLDQGLSPDFLGSRTGSGLMIGAWEGNLELMRLFISRGADINLLNANGESALALAAWRGNLEAVRWLIDRGARINAADHQWSALHYAVFGGHEEVADYLIAQGADINARTTNGSTVLMMAAYEGRGDMVRKLLEKGADRAPKNDWGDGVLEWSMRYNHLDIARMVTNPEEFNIAVSQPKEKWGGAQRSLRSSKDLEILLDMREKLIERGMATINIDKRIAAERARIVRAELDDRPGPTRAVTLEVTASRHKPNEQSVQIVGDRKAPSAGYKVPPATFSGKPKMPLKGPVKNY